MMNSASIFSGLKAVFAATILTVVAVPAANAASQAEESPSGKILVVYEAGADELSEEIGKILKEEPIFDALAASVGEAIFLPRDITVVFRNCDKPNAFYVPAKQEIVMCYDLISSFAQSFAGSSENEEELGQNIIGASIFFFYHELGHALIHQLDIPVMVRQEDVADNLAALIILDGDEEGEGAMMLASTVLQFADLASKNEKLEDLAFWGEHSFDQQRMYSLICMIYGSNPTMYAELVGEDGLPEARAKRCPSEYEQGKRSWERLLENHLRPDPAE